MKPTTEIWKPVPGHSEILASSFGRVVRQPKYVPLPNGGFRRTRPLPTYGYVCRSRKDARHTYRNVMYRGIGTIKVHQAVCAAFHGPKPFDDAVVLHLDEDGENNAANNLKWGTQKENLNAAGFLKYCRRRTGKDSPTVKAMAARKARHIPLLTRNEVF